jgi:hypothetical protein
MRPPTPIRLRNIALARAILTVVPRVRWCPVVIPTHLMAYEAVAKAIFIRANGGPAYYRATGIVEDAV